MDGVTSLTVTVSTWSLVPFVARLQVGNERGDRAAPPLQQRPRECPTMADAGTQPAAPADLEAEKYLRTLWSNANYSHSPPASEVSQPACSKGRPVRNACGYPRRCSTRRRTPSTKHLQFLARRPSSPSSPSRCLAGGPPSLARHALRSRRSQPAWPSRSITAGQKKAARPSAGRLSAGAERQREVDAASRTVQKVQAAERRAAGASEELLQKKSISLR